MRPSVWAGYSGETKPGTLTWLWFLSLFSFILYFHRFYRTLVFILIFFFNTLWKYNNAGAANFFCCVEWQVAAEEHGSVFCWDWSSASRWLPGSFYPRRASWRKPDKSGKRTPRAARSTRRWGKSSAAERNGHRKITVRLRPRSQAPGPATSYSSVSWPPRNTWTTGPWRLIGEWCVGGKGWRFFFFISIFLPPLEHHSHPFFVL